MSLSTYRPVIDYLKAQAELPGDILEIGALVGDGTRQLADAWPHKLIWALDIFDVNADPSVTQNGQKLSELYRGELGEKTQRQAFDDNTRGLENIRVIEGDSRCVDFPPTRLYLAIIDGGHTSAVVQNDWWRVATKAPRYVAFHDYRHDLPAVTAVIDEVTEGFERYELGGAWLMVRI